MTRKEIKKILKPFIKPGNKLHTRFWEVIERDLGKENFKDFKESVDKETSYIKFDLLTKKQKEIFHNMKLYHIVHDLYEVPMCEVCKINYCSYFGFTDIKGYIKTCGVSCSNKHPDYVKKITTTNLKKYGVPYAISSNVVKNKTKKTLNERYGGHQMYSNEIKQKIENTNLERYGVKNVFQNEQIKEKITETNLIKYGCEYATQNKLVKQKIENTNLKKYGCKYTTQNEKIREKMHKTYSLRTNEQIVATKEKTQKTCMKKYGVNNATQNPEIFEKQQHNSFLSKDYTLPSGKIIKVQGYEGYGLDILLKTFKEDQIVTSVKEIHNHVGFFNYKFENKSHKYFPDFYIPCENKIIEIKSTYTFEKEFEQNIKKKEACIKKGLLFEFWIFNKNKLVSII